MPVKFLDLQSQYRSIKDEVDAAVSAVLESGHYVLGPEVAAFEQEFASAHGAEHGIAVNTGTSALHLALLAWGIGAGDEVIVPAMTFTATAAAVAYTGATPILVDVDPMTFTMDPALVEARITPRTRAIMPVHLYGQAADMESLCAIARKHGLALIEDAAQAHLAEYEGRKVGGIGDIAGFSFYPGKNLGAYGEGGMALTNDPELAAKLRLYRDWGAKQKYDHEILAYNYRMDAIQGAVLRVKLRHLSRWTEQRRQLAELYREQLGNSGIACAAEVAGRTHVYHIFSIFHRERDALQEHLGALGIQTGKHYPVPLHLQGAYSGLDHKRGDFPLAEAVAATQLSLPLYPEMPESDVLSVVEAIKGFRRGPTAPKE